MSSITDKTARPIEPKAFLARVETARRMRERTTDGYRLTDMHVAVARKLAFCRNSSPSHRFLAAASSCSVRTVQRALRILHALGLLTWTRRVVAVCGIRRQIANDYRLRTVAIQPSLPGLQDIKFLGIKSSAKLAISPPRHASAAQTEVRERNAAALQAVVRQQRMARMGAIGGRPAA